MKLIIRNTAGLMLILLLMAACARQIDESDSQVEQRLLNAFVQVNYSGITPTASGLFFIPQGPQHGGQSPVEGNLLYMRFTTRDMNGNIVRTSVDSLARMLGTHSFRTYYGPQFSSMASGAAVIGIQEAFSYMSPGDKARVLLPSWLSSHTVGGHRTATTTFIHDLELLRVVTDMAAFQTDSLQSFSQIHYGGIDSLKNDWYFVELTPGTGDLPAVGDTMKIRYAGYLLDGFMFDTNIRDTAVYEAAKFGQRIGNNEPFNELTVIIRENVSDMVVVSGFAHALKEMTDGMEAVTFFSSDYGYGSRQEGQIPPFSMLRFYVTVTINRVAAD